MTPSRATALSVCAALALASIASPLRADSEVVVREGDAYVSRDAAASTWTIGNGAFSLTVGLDATSRVLNLIELRNTALPSPFPITVGPATTVNVGGRSTTLGGTLLPYDSFRAVTHQGGVRLDLVFVLREPRVRVTRSYASYGAAPVVEMWTTIESLSGDTSIEGLNAFQIAVPPATIHTLSGLESDGAGNPDPTTARQFTIEHRTVSADEQLDLGSGGRSSERTVPWFVTENLEGALFGGLMWSGAWTMSIDHTGAAMRLAIGLPDTVTTAAANQPVEAPHGILGLVAHPSDVPLAAAEFVINGIRNGRPFTPLVTYNTWFAYGTEIDEESMLGAIDAAARVGAQLFVLDAGWYEAPGRMSPGDFTTGLGSWKVDLARFPSGLRALADAARAQGMQFGLWVEPEHVTLANVGGDGLAEEEWLAQDDGRYINSVDDAPDAQICLADARAREWVLDRLTALIDEVQPEYLKWDNNLWVNCNRPGHGHGARDGNFAHVTGLYDVLSRLRARYPDLQIENVSGGGNRLDFGMLRYTDTGWMDDRTAPSAIVRHNLQGLGQIFPPAYLLSFAIGAEGEPLRYDAPDMALYIRSRMAGLLGLTFRHGELGEADEAELARQIELYKELATVLRRGAGILLSEQAVTGAPPWEAMEIVTAQGDAVLFVYENDPGVESITVRPRALQPAATYTIVSADRGPIGTASGADLMADGIDVVKSPASGAHILLLTPEPPQPPEP